MPKVRVNAGGTFRKWVADIEPGTRLEDVVFRGMHDGKYGPLIDLETKDGHIVVSAFDKLYKALQSIRVGRTITIEYLGLFPTKTGAKTFHDANVFADPDDIVKRRPVPACAESADGVPFEWRPALMKTRPRGKRWNLCRGPSL
jgi:hypothetical protein